MSKGHFDFYEEVDKFEKKRRSSYEDQFFAAFPTKGKKNRMTLKDALQVGMNEKAKEKKVQNTSRLDVIDDNLLLVNEKPVGSISSKYFPIDEKNSIDDEKYREKKVVACSFVKKGYGFGSFEEYIDEQRTSFIYVTRQKYKAFIVSIIQQGYRKIEWFLRVQCEKMINSIKHEEMRLIVRYLLQAKTYFYRQDAHTFNKFISIIYALHSVNISEHEAVQLYKAIMETLKQLMSGQKIIPIYQKKKSELREIIQENLDIWNQKYEEQLINFYKLNQNFIKIHKCFRNIHPEVEDGISPDYLKKKVEGKLREILKTIKFLYSKNKEQLPRLLELNENKISYLIKSSTCNNIRLSLLDYRQDLQNLRCLSELINSINDKIKKSDQQKKSSKIDSDLEETDVFQSKNQKSKESTFFQRVEHKSKDIRQGAKMDELYKVNRFAARPIQKRESSEVKLNHYDLSDQYSDN